MNSFSEITLNTTGSDIKSESFGLIRNEEGLPSNIYCVGSSGGTFIMDSNKRGWHLITNDEYNNPNVVLCEGLHTFDYIRNMI